MRYQIKMPTVLVAITISAFLSSCRTSLEMKDNRREASSNSANLAPTPPQPRTTPIPQSPPQTSPSPKSTATPKPATPAPTATAAPSSSACSAPGGDDPSLDGEITPYPLSSPYSKTDPYQLGHYVYLPQGYSKDPCKKWPLVFFMHGVGELGNGTMSTLPNILKNNSPLQQIQNGKAAQNHRPFLNAIVVQAQGFKSGTDASGKTINGWNSWQTGYVKTLIDYIKKNRRVDENRIYITGLSLGGGGTWAFAKNYPTIPAAVVPICGTDNSSTASNVYTDLPLWAFHNFTDPTVSRVQTEKQVNNMMAFLQDRLMDHYPFGTNKSAAANDMSARPVMGSPYSKLPSKWQWEVGIDPSDQSRTALVTIFKRSSHDAWTAAYNNQAMWEWMFSQVKKAPLNIQFSSLKSVDASGISLTKFPRAAGVSITFEAQVSGATEVVINLRDLGGSPTTVMTNVGSGHYRITHIVDPGEVSTGTKRVSVTAASSQGRVMKTVNITAE